MKKLICLINALAIAASAFTAIPVTAEEQENYLILADNNDNTVTTLRVGMEVHAKAYHSDDANLYIAVYNDDGKLTEIKTAIAAGGSVAKTDSVVISEDTPYIKLFLWDEDMEPLSESLECKVQKTITEPGAVLINEDFTALTDSWGFTGEAGAVAENGTLSLCDNTSASKIRTTIKTMDEAVSAADALTIKFDWASDVEQGKERSSGLELRDTNGALLFAMYGKGGSKTDSGIKYATAEADDATAWQDLESHTSGKLYTVEITANFLTAKLSGTITDTASGTVLTEISETDMAAEDFAQMRAQNYYSLAPMTLDNVVVKSPDKHMTSFTVTGNEDTAPLKNAEIVIGKLALLTDENGKAEGMLPEGEYTYTITVPNHKAYEGTITAGAAEDIKLTYAGESVPTRIVISGGDDGIYKPASGANSTVNAYSAVVYDQINQPMNEEVEWSIVAEDGASIDDNLIITVTDDFLVTDDNGETIVVKAASKTNPEIYATADIHVYNVARAENFDIVGPSEIKDGLSATYTIGNVKDQYGADYTGDATYTLTATEDVAVDAMTVTPNTGTVQTKNFEITATASDSGAISTKTVTAYAFDFYESQLGGSYYGDVRTAEVAGDVYTVWPSSSAADAEQTITLPQSVKLEAGTSKAISYSTAWTEKTVFAQKRYMVLNFSNGSNVTLGYQAGVYLSPEKVDGQYSGGYRIEDQNNEGVFEETLMLIKTDIEGNSILYASYAGGEPVSLELGNNIGELVSIEMQCGRGIPDARLLAIRDIKICDSEIAEVEIMGDNYIAKIENRIAQKEYKASVFALDEGETFAWSVTDINGNAAAGVTIDENGVLSVADSVSTGTEIVIRYTSNLDAQKYAEKSVTINDYAAIESFVINGARALEAGDNAVYSVSDIIDEYGDTAEMEPTYEIISGADIASIDSVTGNLTTNAGKTGTVTIEVTLGNTGKKKTLTTSVEVDKYFVSGEAEDSVSVNVSELANYSADTMYRVTTATADGELVSQYETVHTNGIVTVDMRGANQYEVSPIYSYSNVGDVRNGYEILIPNGFYDFTFKKSASPRGDIFVNGDIVGQNIDQVGKHRTSVGALYSVNDVKIDDGIAVVSMKDNTYLSDIVVKKAPSILPRKTHIYFAGDSSQCGYHGELNSGVEIIGGLPRGGRAQTGLAQVLDKFLSDDMNITNLAESGNYASAWCESYFEGGVLNQAQPGDYFIVPFAYNDRAKSSAEDMKAAIEFMVDECRAKGIIPIVMSSQRISGVWPGNDGGYGKFFEVSRTVAQEKDTLFVDMTDISGEYFEEMGYDTIVRNVHIYSNGASQDKTHYSYFGAMKMAELLIQNIADQQAQGVTNSRGESFDGFKFNKEASYTFTMVDNSTQTLKID